MDSEEPKEREEPAVRRVLIIGFSIFVAVAVAILVAAWLIGDQGNLPFDYDGFD
jgi:hypothetical protein